MKKVSILIFFSLISCSTNFVRIENGFTKINDELEIVILFILLNQVSLMNVYQGLVFHMLHILKTMMFITSQMKQK